jgi:LysR family transcriptional repressor of citA
MDTTQLKTFLSLAETKNFSASAKNLTVAQSTVSKRIQELEREVGQELFIRGRSGVELTRTGKALLEYAEQIVNMEEKALLQINRTSQYSGYLILGTVYAYYDLYLSKQLRRFMTLCPEISIRVKFGHSGLILSQVGRGQIDIAFTHHPFQHPEYICKSIGEDDVVLVTDAENQVYRDGISYTRIKELPLLSSNFLYATTQSWLFPRHQQFQLELDIASCALPLLKGEKWYTFLARKLVERQLASGELREVPVLDGKIPPVQYYLVYREENSRQLAVQEWLAF